MDKTRHQAQRTIIFTACVVIQHTHSLAADFIVVSKLVGYRCDPSLFYAGHVVIPQVNAFISIFPVGDPAEISRINICGDSIFEAMQLVGTDEMHLAR